MAVHWIKDLGAAGLYRDTPGDSLPENAWTNAVNVRFRDGAIERFEGHSVFTDGFVAPYSLFYVSTPTQGFIVYGGDMAVFAVSEDGATNTDITRQSEGTNIDYALDSTQLWDGTTFSGRLILTNGIDPIQLWVAENHTSSRLVDLTGAPTDFRARFIKSYKDFLVAAYITDSSGNANPFLVQWSVSADAGALPISWDYTDPSLDAGRVELAGEDDPIVEMENMGDTLFIYRRRTAWTMDFIGGTFIMRFARRFPFGALARNCVASFMDKHFVLGDGYAIVHDGTSITEPLNKKLIRWLFNSIDPDRSSRCWVGENPLHKEIWIAFPETGANYPSKAVVWNWEYDTTQVRDLPHASSHVIAKVARNIGLADSGTIDDETGTIDDTPGTFDRFDDQVSTGLGQSLLLSVPVGAEELSGEGGLIFNATSQSYAFNSSPFESTVAREPLIAHQNKITQVQGVYLTVESPTQAVFDISVGARNSPADAINYQVTRRFTTGTGQRKIDLRLSGRTIDLRITSQSSTRWRITGIGLDINEAGSR